jgi:hypothetical protein
MKTREVQIIVPTTTIENPSLKSASTTQAEPSQLSLPNQEQGVTT